ncbi:primosomal protein N' [Blastochloris viridis]|uniref:Replication restart protein PriA n=1 Tax=Blastochloris viridis TaxID=1079 RepID=A0A0H5BP84_BLAVI|nr:primosomal protein N' [Blastochloris viridis]ALK07864.1 Primosomal protein N' [Blastochloris viridis]BAR98888.1 helicase PriA essential for oriC/DnaA-independent DNA replication [Blastochloris viridis]CUU43786.1 Primosomal protein N' [Blastochloris viridis]
MTARFAEVLVPLGIDQPYSYAVPDGLAVAVGDLVHVPLGPRTVTGVVWSLGATPRFANPAKLRKIDGRVEVEGFRPELMNFIEWVAGYTVAPRGAVLRMALRLNENLGPPRPRAGIRRAGPEPARMTAQRARVLAALEGGLSYGKSDLAREVGVSVAVIEGLVDEGTLEAVELAPEVPAARPDPDHPALALSATQAEAAASLAAAASRGGFATFLLDGVTGSGKTEVYFEAVAAALRRGRQVLLLLPEIALTTAFLERFVKRFGVRPAEWHSEVPPRRRERTWRGLAAGDTQVVAGARSALFLPFRDLGLIVVDEEHDASYKQEDGVAYNARDMAVVRARLAEVPIVLASATPSIESEVNARRGRYRRLALPSRVGGAALPEITAIDMTRQGPERGRWIAPSLVAAIEATIARQEQALLFLNRRGYAPLTLCRACGHRLRCPSCDAWLVEHRFRRRLVCHHCGYSMPRPTACPHCQAAESFVAVGPGVERLAEEAQARFPDARLSILSSDLVVGVERLRAEITAIERGEVDLVIGTQLIAKGHHFPRLTLAGIVDGDLGLAHGDPRAAERTFQLLHQVVGRAGRESGHGSGLIQTYQPKHPVMTALIAGDRELFYDTEIAARERAGLPPFGRLATLLVAAADAAAAEAYARTVAAAAPSRDGVRVLGPAEAPIAVLRGRHRVRLLVRAARAVNVSDYVREWLAKVPPPRSNVTLAVDVDPQSFA